MKSIKRHNPSGYRLLSEDDNGTVVLYNEVVRHVKCKDDMIARLTSRLRAQEKLTEETALKLFITASKLNNAEHELELTDNKRLQYTLIAGILLFMNIMSLSVILAYKLHIFK